MEWGCSQLVPQVGVCTWELKTDANTCIQAVLHPSYLNLSDVLSALPFPCLHYIRGRFDPTCTVKFNSKYKVTFHSHLRRSSIDIGPIVQEHLDELVVSGGGGDYQRRPTVVVRRVYRCFADLKEIATSPEALMKFLWVMKNHD